MARSSRRSHIVTLAVAATVALLTASCGNTSQPTLGQPQTGEPPASTSPSDALGAQPWLLQLTLSGGGDGEKTQPLWLLVTPKTGEVQETRVPGSYTSDTYGENRVVLVSADHRYAVPDSRIGSPDRKTGKLRVYGLGSTPNQTINARAKGIQPVAWAFDPQLPASLRLVDSKARVWLVDVNTTSFKRDGSLPAPKQRGWFYANGFDHVTGLPYIENPDNNQTMPAGNGQGDKRPVERDGGTLLVDDGGGFPGVPKAPCDLSGAFTDSNKVTWLFCADKAAITTYRLMPGASDWATYGKPTRNVVPPSATELPIVLPPVS